MATAVLETVADYINQARVLLQDTIPDYRYTDEELLAGFNFGITEAYNLRFDIFVGLGATSARVPRFTPALPYYPTVDATPVNFPIQYRVALVFYTIGHAQLRDDENDQDQRAVAFKAMFRQQLGVQ